jgi:hypothetical protein
MASSPTPRRHRRGEAEPRAPEGGVCGRAAEILGESGDVFESRADLLRIEIDGEAAEADDVEAPAGGKTRVVLHRREQRSGPPVACRRAGAVPVT